MQKSLQAQALPLAAAEFQLTVLNGQQKTARQFTDFRLKLADADLFPLKPVSARVLQVNVGKMCNQVCRHCHVDAGPDRKEIMTRETMQTCLEALASTKITTVDITGGAPEMNPDFRWFVTEIRKLGRQVMVRCNLTIILANPKYHDLPEFFRENQVHVVSSLPYFSATRTDAQRGSGVFEKSIKALQMLNAVGYGNENSGLKLDLVFNPSGAFLPGIQRSLENEFKWRLHNDHSIAFNNLFAITNLPISRFLDYLIESQNYDTYMQKLVNAFNPAAAANVMCRDTISVSWDGFLYDCDFNQMLDLKLAGANHISQFNEAILSERNIVVNQHCYGCTAGAGSSCGGETVG